MFCPFIKNLITLFTFDLHFISAFHLLCLSQGKQELVPCDEWSGAAGLSSHPLNFQINKINKPLPTSGMKGTSFWQSPTRITGAREDGKGWCGGWGVHLCHEGGSSFTLYPDCDGGLLLARTQDVQVSAHLSGDKSRVWETQGQA